MKKLISQTVLVVVILFGSLPMHLSAATRTMELRAGWNLISFSEQPEDAAISAVFQELIANGVFDSIWTYDAEEESWSTYPTPVSGIPSLENVEVGKGYWLKVVSSTEMVVTNAETIPTGDMEFVAGWNLVGFSIQDSKDYRYLLSGVSINQIWTFDPDAGEFKGVEFAAGTNTTIREDFTLIEPGRGYWIYAGDAFTLGPVLGTSMESDKDFSPFLEAVGPGERVAWSVYSLGDEDIGEDGYFDTPQTQRTLTFRDEHDIKRIYVYNKGSGALNFSAEIL
ncbi:MAG: hypothetical protein GY866_32070, partial [Proteobacteria bacterium]|nr:hypothetical protein [Pseudomonadota bacterium]